MIAYECCQLLGITLWSSLSFNLIVANLSQWFASIWGSNNFGTDRFLILLDIVKWWVKCIVSVDLVWLECLLVVLIGKFGLVGVCLTLVEGLLLAVFGFGEEGVWHIVCLALGKGFWNITRVVFSSSAVSDLLIFGTSETYSICVLAWIVNRWNSIGAWLHTLFTWLLVIEWCVECKLLIMDWIGIHLLFGHLFDLNFQISWFCLCIFLR